MVDSIEKDVKDFFDQNFENYFIYLYFLNEFFCSIKNRRKTNSQVNLILNNFKIIANCKKDFIEIEKFFILLFIFFTDNIQNFQFL